MRHDGKFVSIPKDSESTPYDISLDYAIELVKAKREADAKALLKTFDEDPGHPHHHGALGTLHQSGKDNVKIPKGEDVDSIDWARVEQLKAGVIKAFAEDDKWTIRLKGPPILPRGRQKVRAHSGR